MQPQLSPEFNNGIFDPVAHEGRMAQMFQQRNANYDAMQEDARKDFLAERQMPSQLSGFQFTDAENQGKLAALPQQLEIAKTKRTQEQKFLLLRELLDVTTDTSIPEEDKDQLIKLGLGKVTEMTAGSDPNARLANTEAASRAIAHARFAYDSYKRDPSTFINMIKASMQGLSATPEHMNAVALEQEKGFQARNTALMEEQKLANNEWRAAGASNQLAEILRKAMNDVRVDAWKDARLLGTLDSLGFILDSANKLRVKEGSTPSPDATSKAQQLVDRTRENIEQKIANLNAAFYGRTNVPYVPGVTGGTPTGPITGTPQITPGASSARVTSGSRSTLSPQERAELEARARQVLGK